MFGQLSAGLLNFFLGKKWFALLLLAGVSAVLVLGMRRLQIAEDIYSVFPKGEEYSRFSAVLQRNNLNKQVVFSINASEDQEENFDDLDSVSVALQTEFEGDLDDFKVYRDVDQGLLLSYLQRASIAYFDSMDYARASERLNQDSIRRRLEEVKQKLTGGSALFLGDFYAQDPLGIAGTALQRIALSGDSSNYDVEDGIVFDKDHQRILFFATVHADLKNTDALVSLDEQLQLFAKQMNQDHPNLQFDYFGTFQIAAQNAVQVKKDTFYTLMVSLGLIILLLVLYYRSIFAPFYFVLPAAFGILCGVGMVGYLQPEVSAISLATSGILLGIVLDYAFHFFTHYKHSGDLVETIREISSPMIVGSFTTVAAFAALLFTDSVVLRNFGLIALFTLLGSAIFTLYFLPVLMDLFRLRLKSSEHQRGSLRIPKWGIRLALLAIVGFTVYSLFYANTIRFDADLNNLSYHPESLKEKEDAFTGIHPGREKKVYVFVNSANPELAREHNNELFQKLTSGKEELHLSEVVSMAPYALAKKQEQQAEMRWEAFWSEHDSILSTVQATALDLGFSEQAFMPFLSSTRELNFDKEAADALVEQTGLGNLYDEQNGEYSYMTSVVVNRDFLPQLKETIGQVEDSYVLDISEIAGAMLDSVRSDFNFLLLFSSLLVFGSLLVVYGRIELALFAFLPMVLAWIWIISLSALFGLEFNFVNIIIATFIFGLGDDFSIFITDGLIQRYKTGKDSISSYRSAIVLSALTTVIGTGALYFAKHPAIHSIALISVIGILTILLVTLYIQPGLFRWMVTRRTDQKRGPITFFTFVYSCMLFAYFFLGSMFLTIFLVFVLIPLPVKRVAKKRIMNFLVSKLAKSTLYAGFQIKKIVVDAEKLDYSQPKILVANHASFLDILAVLMLHPKTIIMVKKWVYNSPVFGLFIRYCGYIFAEEGADGNVDEIKKRFADGYSLAIFPEGTRSKDGKIKRFHKGAFLLAQELNVPVQPVILLGFHEVNPRNDIMINRGTAVVRILDPMVSEEGESYKSYTKRVQTRMREAFAETSDTYAKSAFWFPRVIQNYVLKGPVLEWYVRVKYRLEQRNFEFYDELIGDRKTIYDIGCGYGYLSYYLHYRNNERTIFGMDYDEEKVLTAAHGIRLNDQLHFDCADIRKYDLAPADAIFLNDVLHYLPKVDQDQLLERLVGTLNPGGILFIRDGVKELQERFKKTRLTEILSTRLFKFNKAEHELEFISMKAMENFATEKGLHYEMMEHSKTTSNVLFVLRKP